MAEFNINGFSFDLSSLKNLSKEEIAQKDNIGLLSLFNIIDTNKDNVIDNEEISIFAKKFQDADKDNSKSVDQKEFKIFLKELKKVVNIDFNFDVKSVMNLFNMSLNKSEVLEVFISDNIQQEKTDNEVKDDTIAYMENEFKTGLEYLEGYEEGIIEKGYNAIKEFLNSRMAKSNFVKALYVKNENAEMLSMAKNGTLTRREYYQRLRDTLFDTFPGKDTLSYEQKEKIKQHINTLDETQLVRYQNKILSMASPDNENYKNELRRFLDEFKSDTTTAKNLTMEFVQDNLSYKKTVKSEELNNETHEASSEELVTFEEVFKNQHGVEYDRNAMEILFERRNGYLLEKQKNERKNQIHSILDNAIALNKGNALSGTSNELTISSENLQNALILALQQLGAKDDNAKTALLQKLTGDNSVQISGNSVQRVQKNEFSAVVTPYELNNLVSKIISFIDLNASDTDLDMKEAYYVNAYNNAFGEQTTRVLAEAYINDNQSFVKNTRTTVEIAGAAAMVIGLFTCPPLAIGGALVSSAGGVALEMTNEATKEHADKEKILDLCKELAQNAALFAAGIGAGKAGMAAKTMLIAKKCPRLVACIADIGVDSTLSLLADLSLTGQINLEGEGIGQAISIIAGHIKGGKIKLKNSIQDCTPGKNPAFNNALNNLSEVDPKLYDDYVLLRSKNMLPQSRAILYNPKDASFTKEFLDDVKIMAAAVRSGKNPIDAFIPKIKNLDEAIKLKQEGEVFSLEGTNDIYIKTKDGAVKLDMDRDTYYNLFPPIKTHASMQDAMLGDCYLVAGFLDASMHNPVAKVEFLKHFHQKGNDIVFDVGYYNHQLDQTRNKFSDMTIYDRIPTEITFKNACNRSSIMHNASISGSDGLKIAEQAIGYKLCAQRMIYDMVSQKYPDNEIIKYIDELTKIFNNPSYKPSKEFKNHLVEAYKMPNQMLEATPSDIKAWLMTKIDDIEALRARQQGNGGRAEMVLSSFYDLGKDAVSVFYNIENCASLITSNCIITASTIEGSGLKDILMQLSMFFTPSNFIVSKHQFRIASIDKNTKTVDIINPWDCSRTVKLDFDTFSKHFKEIYVTDVRRTVRSQRCDYLIKCMEKFGIPTKADNGRYFSTEELINKYIEKTGKIYDSYMHKNNWSDDDVFDEYKAYLDEPRVKSIVDKIHKRNHFVSSSNDSIPPYLAILAQAKNPAELNKFLDVMSNFVTKADNIKIGFFNNVLYMKKSIDDYALTMEHAEEIITKMQQKNYDDSDIEYVLQLLSKDNYDSLKYLFE